MKAPHTLRRVLLLGGAVAAAWAAGLLRAEEFEAVASRASADYVRAKNPDGSYQAETYAFGKGGYYSGPIADTTIAHLDFMDVARVVALPLAAQHYLPAKDPKATKLLIMVYWGTTFAQEHASESGYYQQLQDINSEINNAAHGNQSVLQQLDDEQAALLALIQSADRQREIENSKNARMLGYDSWWDATRSARPGTAQALERKDLMAELEENRYFVVLMAYDFQLLQQQKKHKLLWETRFSIRERNHAFDQALPAMALQASSYFGKDSGGLKHDALPEGHVDIGDLRNLGEVPAK